jgi:AAA domain
VRALDACATGNDLAVVAGAGTGKSSTLVMMAEATRARGLHMAFNRAARDDAQRRFGPNVECRTAHSLAFSAVGRTYRSRLEAARIPTSRTAQLLGIKGDLDVNGSRITRFHQARLAMNMVRRFCYSNDPEPMARHMEPVNGLDPGSANEVAALMLAYARRAWDDLCAPAGSLRFEHDHYMKMWALISRVLPGDFIMLDEAQDTNPVLEAIFLAQDVQRISQLAGYLLLDYPNQYGIRKVGLYLARQGAIIDWVVPEFLDLLGATATLPTLRRKLHWFLSSCRKAPSSSMT